MLKGITVQGLVCGSYEAILGPLVPPPRGSPRDQRHAGKEKSWEGLNWMTSDTKGQGCLNCMTNDMLGEDRPPGVRSLFSQLCLLLGTRGFLPW